MKRSLPLAAMLALAADALPPVLLPNGTQPIRRPDALPRQPQKLTQADLDRIAAAHAKRDRKAAIRGKGDTMQDLREARDAIDRAIQMQEAREVCNGSV